MSHTIKCRTADGVEHLVECEHHNVCPIYNYHPEYKYFTLQSEAMPDPLEWGVYLAPAHSTCIQPPPVSNNEIQIFNTETKTWSVIPDNRGIYYSTSEENFGQEITVYDPCANVETLTQIQPNFVDVEEGNTLDWNGTNWIQKPITQPTPQEKLQNLGLTVEDLRVLLDL